MRSTLLTLLLLVLIATPGTLRAQEANAGFVQGLWYSKEPIFSGETVRVYAALRNNTDSDLTGIVTFKDGSKVIARKEISALSGRLIEAWADWTPSHGEHTLSVEFSDVELHEVGKDPTKVEVTSGVSEAFVFVDHDTDRDGIGNEEDTDDDNDGIDDNTEKAAGTDPLDPESPAKDAEETGGGENEETGENKSNEGDAEEESNKSEPVSSEQRKGFETIFESGTVNSVLSNVTEKVHESKESLDAYRERRAKEREANTRAEEKAESKTSTSTETETATITRTQLESQSRSFFETLIAGIVGIMDGLYTLLLWTVSRLLSYPGLIQVLLLLAILISVYKLAKRYGNRQQ